MFQGVLYKATTLNPSPVIKEWGFDIYIDSLRGKMYQRIDEMIDSYPIELISKLSNKEDEIKSIAPT